MARPAAALIGEHARALGQDVYLGPAEVESLRGATPMVVLPTGGCVRAEMALAFPYAPEPGDVLLVIGKGGAHYVIGVLEAKGQVSLRFQGDVSLHAVGGTLDLVADERVRVRSPEVELTAEKLRVVADSVIQKATSVYQRVREVLSVHAGERTEHIEGNAHTAAASSTLVTRGVVTINGKQVHLG